MRLAPLALIAVGWSPVGAQPSLAPTQQLLVEPAELARWLRDRDPLVDAARARVTASAAQYQQSRVLPNPQLSVGAGGFVLGKTTTSDDGIDRRLTLGQTTVFTFGLQELVEIGKREPRRRAAELRMREAGETAVAALGTRIGNATSVLGRLAYLAAKREAVATNLEAAIRLRNNEKIRLDNKDLSPLEFGRIELDTHGIQMLLARTEAELAGTAAYCAAVLQAPCSTEKLEGVLDAAATLPAALPDPDAAIAARPLRNATRLEAGALNWDARLAENRRIPDLTLGVGYTFDNLVIAGNQHHTVALTVQFPLPFFDRGDRDAAVARATARALEQETRADAVEARGTVDSLLVQHRTLTHILQQLEAESIPRSTLIIAQTRKAFDLGQARLADLLSVERSHRDLLLEVLDVRFARFEVRSQLRQALGLDDQLARSVQRRTP
ncbi:MAG: TolC family protein [Deltaproteobacteria bacterium]|nr:TolC family protein [Deltaproteobacteria bacterium]